MKYFLQFLIILAVLVSRSPSVYGQVSAYFLQSDINVGSIPVDTTISVSASIRFIGTYYQGHMGRVKLVSYYSEVTVPSGIFAGPLDEICTVTLHPTHAGCLFVSFGMVPMDSSTNTNSTCLILGYAYSRSPRTSTYTVEKLQLINFGHDSTLTHSSISLYPDSATQFFYPVYVYGVKSPFSIIGSDSLFDPCYNMNPPSIVFAFSRTTPGHYVDTVFIVTGPTNSDSSRVILIGDVDAAGVGVTNPKSVPATIFPNPNNGVAQIQFLHATSHWQYTVYDMLGRRAMEQNGWNQAEGNSIKLNATEIPSGVYTIVIETDMGCSAQKMAIVR